MGRPDKKQERRRQILDATEIIVARYGLEGATLDRIAKEADIARALIRHNLGNWEQVIAALVERFLGRAKEQMDELYESLGEEERVYRLLDVFFDPKYSDSHTVRLASALILGAGVREDLRKPMGLWCADFISSLESELKREFPDSKSRSRSMVAAGICGIYFNVDALADLQGIGKLRKSSKEACLYLLNSLE